MATTLKVVTSIPQPTISGVTTAGPQPKLSVAPLPVQPQISVAPAPVQPKLTVTPTPSVGTNYNPQNPTPAPIQQAPAAPLFPNTQPAAQTLQPSTPPPSNMTFGFMDGSKYDASGNQLNAPVQLPQMTATQQPSTPYPAQSNYPVTPQVQGYQETAPPMPTAPQVDTTKLNQYEQDYMNTLKMSPEEEQAQRDLNNLITSYRMGVTNIEGKPIALEFQTGQKENLERRMTDMAIPLEQRLALEQAKRTSSQNASAFALQREDARLKRAQDVSKPVEIGAGSSLIDPTTGRVLYSQPATPSYQANPVTGELFDTKTGMTNGYGLNSSSMSGGGFPAGAQTPGSAAAVNNPLGIKPNGQFTQYQTPQQGFQAGVDLVKRYQTGGPAGMNSNSTLNQMVNTWITGNPNNTTKTGYNATNVAQYLQQMGVNATPNTPIGQIDSTKLAAAIAHFETGYSAGSMSSFGTDAIGMLAQQVMQNPAMYQNLTQQQQGAVNARLAQAGVSVPNGQSQYQVQTNQRILQSVQELLPLVNNYTVGLVGKTSALIPGTDAYNFNAQLRTLKSNISFGALTAMREASKTGGALGQVSDKEAALLESTLGALDIGQSPEQFKQQLQKISESITRWNQAYAAANGEQQTGSQQPVTIQAPNGQTYTFPNQQAADAFRQAAGF